jgi:hypothetical protein
MTKQSIFFVVCSLLTVVAFNALVVTAAFAEDDDRMPTAVISSIGAELPSNR